MYCEAYSSEKKICHQHFYWHEPETENNGAENSFFLEKLLWNTYIV
jgi:hypothetical protein